MKKHQSLFVGITTLCIMAGMIGLLANCIGILFAAIIQDMDFKAGDMALYYTIKSLVSALTLKFTIKWIVSDKSRYAMAFMGLLASLSYMSMYFFTALWQWYVAAVVIGFAAGPIFTSIPIILNSWFKKNNGKIIGLVMSGSGLAGMLFSPVTSAMVQRFGWREAAVFTGLLNILLVCIPSLLFLKARPNEESVGSASPSRAKATDSSAPLSRTDDTLKPVKTKVPGWVLPLCALCIMFPALEITFANQLTVFSMSVGYTLAVGGTMTSFAMFGNVSGKFLLGALADKFGIFKSMWFVLSLGILSMTLFLLAGSGVFIAYGAALTFGFLYSLYSTGPAIFMLQIYGRREYAEKFSSIQAINTFMVALFSSVIAYIYDLTGSFAPVFILFMIMNIVTIIFVKILSDYVKSKRHYE